MPWRNSITRSNGNYPFDYYVRSVTTAVLALGIIGVTLYAMLVQVATDRVLIAWSSGIIGLYFGLHISKNGSEMPGPPIDSQVTVRKEHGSTAQISTQRVEDGGENP